MEQFDLFGKSEIISGVPKAPEPTDLDAGAPVKQDEPEQIFPPSKTELGQIKTEPNPHELPAYAEFKQYLTPENPFINCQTTDDINELWNVEWQKIVERTDALKNQKSELTKQVKQIKGQGGAKIKAPIYVKIKEVDAQIKSLKGQEDNLQLYQTAVSLRFVQKIVDNIFSFEPQFNLEKTLEDCWETDDYEKYLIGVAIPKVKSL